MLNPAKVYRPRLFVDFHTESAYYRMVREPSATVQEGLNQEVLSISTTKALGDGAGTFNLTLTGKKDSNGQTWMDKLNPQDLVVITMQRMDPADPTNPDSKPKVVMVGLIDIVTDGFDGTQGRVINVQGRDFGKVLLKAIQQFFVQEQATALKDEAPLLAMGFGKGTPAFMVAWTVTERLFKNLMALEFTMHGPSASYKVTLPQILRFVLGSIPELVPFTSGLFAFEGPVWNYIQSMANMPFNEIFVDVRETDKIMNPVSDLTDVELHSGMTRYDLPPAVEFDGFKVCLYLRPTPFSKDNWATLQKNGHNLDSDDVIRYSLSKTDNEHMNVFQVDPVTKLISEQDFLNLVPPLKNDPAVLKKYGLSLMTVSIRAFNTDQDVITNAVDYAKKLQGRLQEWYGANEKLESGVIAVKGHGKYHIGEVVNMPWRGNKSYYIEGVTHTFPLWGEFQTSLQITRGH